MSISPVSSFTNSVWPQKTPSQERLEVTVPDSSPAIEAQEDAALLGAKFHQLERNYYETSARTNPSTTRSQAPTQSELDSAYRALNDFAEKHPQLKFVLPMNPFVPTKNDCAMS